MPIYTRKGDKGETSLFGGKRVSKYDLRVETYGTVDELNSVIGIVVAQAQVLSSKYKVLSIERELIKIQHNLLMIGSFLANPDTQYSIQNTKYLSMRVDEFEKLIDEMTEKMPVLKNFILPGGSTTGSFLHLSRTVCRRLERRIVRLAEKQAVDENIIKYFNRLSDLLFTMARFMNFKEKQKEIIWPA